MKSRKTCERCGAAGVRLRVARATCPLAGEARPPFVECPPEGSGTAPRAAYGLRLCDLCRAQWVAMTEAWWHDRCPARPDIDDPVPVIVCGVTVEMTQEEAEEHRRYLEGVSG